MAVEKKSGKTNDERIDLNPHEDSIRRVSTGRLSQDLTPILNSSVKAGKIYTGRNVSMGGVVYAADPSKHSLYGVFRDSFGYFGTKEKDKIIYFKATPSRTDEPADSYIHELLVRPMERNRVRQISEEKFYESVAKNPEKAKKTIEDILDGK